MKKRITIEVNDAREAEAIERALQDPASKALTIIVGLLLPCSGRERKRTLAFVADAVDEMNS